MRPWTSLIALLVLVATLGLVPGAAAQEATPDAGAADEALPMMRLVLSELAPGRAAVVGVIRTTYDPNGALRKVAGAGPSLSFVESGSVVVRPVEGPEPMLVAVTAGTPEPIQAEGEQTLDAGSALVIPAGGVAELRNDGSAPAVTLDLLSATDARLEEETGVAHTILARRESTLPEPPVEVVLARSTIPPGDRYPLPSAPVLTVLATVDRSQTFLLTGQSFNRGSALMPVYVLTITPAETGGGTPVP